MVTQRLLRWSNIKPTLVQQFVFAGKFVWACASSGILGPYSRTSYDISQASDWSRWPSRPIRSLRYIVTCTRIRALQRSKYNMYNSPIAVACWNCWREADHGEALTNLQGAVQVIKVRSQRVSNHAPSDGCWHVITLLMGQLFSEKREQCHLFRYI